MDAAEHEKRFSSFSWNLDEGEEERDIGRTTIPE